MTDAENGMTGRVWRRLWAQRARLLLLAGFAAAFGLVSVLVTRGMTSGPDLFFQNWLEHSSRQFRQMVHQVDSVMSPRHDLIAAVTLSMMILTGGAVLHALRSGVRDAVLFSGTTVVSFLLNLMLKPGFARLRPDRSFGFSYPSDHAMMAFAFFIPLSCILANRAPSRPLKALCWAGGGVCTFAVGMSRVFIGRHFISDVIGGYLLSAAVFMVFQILLDTFLTPSVRARFRRKTPNG